MGKPGPKRTSQPRRSPSDSRDRIIESAAGALREEGFAGASARSIAARGGFNSALIFYYFDSINALFLAALERSSSAQLTRYQSATAEVSTLSELLTITSSLLQEDVESGHVKVLAEVIGASATDPVLKRAVVAQVRPWLEFTQATLERVLDNHGLATFPADQLAFGVVSLFLGAELLSTVAGEEHRVADLLNGLAPAGRLLDALSSVPSRRGEVG